MVLNNYSKGYTDLLVIYTSRYYSMNAIVSKFVKYYFSIIALKVEKYDALGEWQAQLWENRKAVSTNAHRLSPFGE